MQKIKKSNKNKESKAYIALKTVTASAMLAALSMVIGIVCKNAFTFGFYRITFENLPVILSGLLFGPIAGAMVGVAADFISCMLSGGGYNLGISVGAAMVGVMSGITPYIIKKKGKLQTAFAVISSHLIGQVLIKSIAKTTFGMPWYGVFIGLGISLFVGAVEFWLINWLRSARGISKYLER